MATYRQLHVKIWSSPDFLTLSANARYVFIYLFSNAHRNEACLYRIAPLTIANETGLPLDIVQSAIDEIVNVGLIKYDREVSLLWVINALKYQKFSPNEVRAIKKDVARFEGHQYAKELLAYYADLISTYEVPSKNLASTPKTPSQDLTNSPQHPSVNDNDKGNDKGKGKGNDDDPTEDKSSVGRKRPPVYDDTDKALVAEMREYREAQGVPPTEKDWHLKQLAVVHKLRNTYQETELRECFVAAQKHPHWCTQIDGWQAIERYLPKWKMSQKQQRDSPLAWMPYVASGGDKPS